MYNLSATPLRCSVFDHRSGCLLEGDLGGKICASDVSAASKGIAVAEHGEGVLLGYSKYRSVM
jgi:hypothetical protein